jgi:hypothetical protein
MYLSGNLTDLAHPAGTSALDSLISSRIRKKLQIFAKFELPLLSKSGFLDIVP